MHTPKRVISCKLESHYKSQGKYEPTGKINQALGTILYTGANPGFFLGGGGGGGVHSFVVAETKLY